MSAHAIAPRASRSPSSLMAGLVWASNAPMTTNPSPDARLRLAWSARPERIEKCRQQSEEELARLPAHMRQAVACEGTTAEYRLQVRIDGALVADRVVHGGGLRRDRRLYVLEEVVLPAAEAAVDVRFDRVDPSEPGAAAASATRARPTPHSPPRNATRFPRTCRSRGASTSRHAKCCS